MPTCGKTEMMYRTNLVVEPAEIECYYIHNAMGDPEDLDYEVVLYRGVTRIEEGNLMICWSVEVEGDRPKEFASRADAELLICSPLPHHKCTLACRSLIIPPTALDETIQ
jgi:hypothetical protein